MRWILLTLIVLLALAAGLHLAVRLAPSATGFQDGRLRPCPDRPNCVMASLVYEDDRDSAGERLQAVMREMPRTELLERDNGYLHYLARTPLLRFRDDVEFLFHPDEKRIDVRSASRLGYSDLGANRARVEEILRAFEAR